MQAVGIRELAAILSHYVRVARTGEVVLVTEHGKVVAALGPATTTRLPRELAGIQTLVDRGVATPGGPKRADTYVRTCVRLASDTAKRIVHELREDAP